MDLRQLSIARLADACRDETDKYRRRETYCQDYCFELFRRAIRDRSETAWDAIVSQYRGILLAWIRRHPASVAAGEDDDYWVNRSFERFWRAIGPDRFDQFASLAALMNYLKVCVHSVLLDEIRSRESAPRDPLPESEIEDGDGDDVENLALRGLSARELWRAVDRELQDESERLVFRLSFVLDLRPREIHERSPDRYSTVAEVYRIKRNVLDRLRRSPEIRDFLD
jgi:DNA-directed RNA polymerase specialized sigma24 family protein